MAVPLAQQYKEGFSPAAEEAFLAEPCLEMYRIFYDGF